MTRSVRYQVRVRIEGQLPLAWTALLAGLEVASGPAGTTLIDGELPDQVALHGLLDTIRDLGLSIVSITAAAAPQPKHTRES